MEDEFKYKNTSLEEKTKSHPCYSGGCQNARMHLPIAPKCNVSCNYCNRKYDCANESRPGVTSDVLNPEQAVERFINVRNKLSNLKVVGIAGPGDTLANFDKTSETLRLIREIDRDITFCLSTNGLMLPLYARDLQELGVTHVTVTLNTIDPKIGAKIYREVNFMGVRLTGEEGSRLLLDKQLTGIKLLVESGIVCKINIVLIKGINDTHIVEVIKKVKEMGVYISNIMPLIPAPGSVFQHMPLTSNIELNSIRNSCGAYLKQMYHCRQCRADAIGALGEDCSADFRNSAQITNASVKSAKDGPKYTFAVASHSGKVIDRHFGHAAAFLIYRIENNKALFVEKRDVESYCEGPGNCENEEERFNKIIKTIEDCDAVLALRIGYSPLKMLEGKGKKVVQTCGAIEEEILKAAAFLQEGDAVKMSK